MTTRPSLTALPQLTNPTAGTTEFIVQDSGVDQYITTPQAIELLAGAVPAGPQGPPGTQGLTGNLGTQGTQGLLGPQGIQGPPGPQGFQGVQGPQGPQGIQGTQGTQGTQGFQGNFGPQGPIGPVTGNLSGGTIGSIPIQTGANTTAFIPLGTPGQILVVQGTTATWVNTASIGVGNANNINITGISNSDVTPYYFALTRGTFPGSSQEYSTYNVSYRNDTGVLSVPKLTVTSTTNSVSTSTGAVIIDGGLGVGEDIHFGGNLYQNGVLFNPVGSQGTVGPQGVQGTIGSQGFMG